MKIREVKLKLTKKQQAQAEFNLAQLRLGLECPSYQTISLSSQTGKLISKFDLIAELSGHGKKAGINQDVLAEQAKAVHRAFTALAFRGAGQAKDEISSA